MKAHQILGKLAEHHERLGKLHHDHADGLPDDNEHASFHRAAGKEHAECAKSLRNAAASVAAALPDAEQFWPGDTTGPQKAAGWERRADIVPDRIRGVIPDNEDHKRKTLEDLGMQRVARFGGPTEDEIAAARLDPELRKLVSDQ